MTTSRSTWAMTRQGAEPPPARAGGDAAVNSEKNPLSTRERALEDQSARQPIVVLSGNLGAGKTSLARQLASHLSWLLVPESIGDNPYLTDYYRDMARWTFTIQMHFLADRVRGYVTALESNRPAILDRSFWDDHHVFGEANLEHGSITPRERRTYAEVFELLTEGLRAPDLIVFLTAPIDVLAGRITSRGAGFDAPVDRPYLELVERSYERWLATWTSCPVIRFDSSAIDPISRPDDLSKVACAIEAALAPRSTTS